MQSSVCMYNYEGKEGVDVCKCLQCAFLWLLVDDWLYCFNLTRDCSMHILQRVLHFSIGVGTLGGGGGRGQSLP